MKFLLLAATVALAAAKANPWVYSTGLVGAPVAYAHHYGYYGLGHHYGYYGKREAEAAPEAAASPEAEADPYLLYGAYGHGLYGGYYGYGYHGYGGWHGLGYALGGCRNYLGGLVPCAGR